MKKFLLGVAVAALAYVGYKKVPFIKNNLNKAGNWVKDKVNKGKCCDGGCTETKTAEQ